MELIVYILTGLGLVVILLTRVRLGKDETTGPMKVNKKALLVHTVAGLIAWVLWVAFIVALPDNDTVGIVALALWWIAVFAGLSLLLRWMPSGGKHATAVEEDEWSEGPGLSILAHFGLLIGVAIFTYAYAADKMTGLI